MKGLQRLLVVGAFGGAAAAIAAMSGAFACSPDAAVWLSVPDVPDLPETEANEARFNNNVPGPLKPGDLVDVHINHFWDPAKGYGKVQINLVETDPNRNHDLMNKWYMGEIEQAPWEVIDGNAPGETRQDSGGKEVSTGSRKALLQIPPGARSSGGAFNVKAEQFPIGSDVTQYPRTPSNPPVLDMPLAPGDDDAGGGVPGGGVPGGGVPAGEVPAGGIPAGGVPGGGTPGGSATGGTAGSGRAPGDRGGASGPGSSASTAKSAASKVDLAPGPGGVVASPANRTAAQEDVVPGAEAQPVRPDLQAQLPNDLWSGVGPSRGVGLLDPLPTPSSGSNPLGGLLLAAGLVTMAGIAAAAGRQRLVLARRTSR